jgi:hypothetical protein
MSDDNELNGTIPTEIGGMTSLTYCALGKIEDSCAVAQILVVIG